MKETKLTELEVTEIKQQKEEADKRLLKLEIAIGIYGTILLLAFMLIAIFVEMATWLKVVLIVVGFVAFLIACFIALRIEQIAGYYKCGKCNHKYVPTYNQVNWAMHCGRKRYLKCPHCGQKSWNKKVISKDE